MQKWKEIFEITSRDIKAYDKLFEHVGITHEKWEEEQKMQHWLGGTPDEDYARITADIKNFQKNSRKKCEQFGKGGSNDCMGRIKSEGKLPELYSPFRPISKDQKTKTRQATGIPTNWITNISPKRHYSNPTIPKWSYHVWWHMITEIVQNSWDGSISTEPSVDKCVAALADRIISGHIPFDEHKLKLIHDNVQDKLWVKLQELKKYYESKPKPKRTLNIAIINPANWTEEDSMEIFGPESNLVEIIASTITEFIRKWRNSMSKDCKKSVTRINDQEFIETISKFLDEQSIDPLYKKVTGDKFNENEGLRLEFKESVFVSEEKLKEEFDNLRNTSDTDKKTRIDPAMKFSSYQKQKHGELILEVVETVCAFLNTKGGELWIGVTDEGKVVGIEAEKSNHHWSCPPLTFTKFREKYLDYISQKLEEHFSDVTSFIDYIDPYITTKNGSKTLFLIIVRRADRKSFVRIKKGKKEDLIPYRRIGSRDIPYDGRDGKHDYKTFDIIYHQDPSVLAKSAL